MTENESLKCVRPVWRTPQKVYTTSYLTTANISKLISKNVRVSLQKRGVLPTSGRTLLNSQNREKSITIPRKKTRGKISCSEKRCMCKQLGRPDWTHMKIIDPCSHSGKEGSSSIQEKPCDPSGGGAFVTPRSTKTSFARSSNLTTSGHEMSTNSGVITCHDII